MTTAPRPRAMRMLRLRARMRPVVRRAAVSPRRVVVVGRLRLLPDGAPHVFSSLTHGEQNACSLWMDQRGKRAWRRRGHETGLPMGRFAPLDPLAGECNRVTTSSQHCWMIQSQEARSACLWRAQRRGCWGTLMASRRSEVSAARFMESVARTSPRLPNTRPQVRASRT